MLRRESWHLLSHFPCFMEVAKTYHYPILSWLLVNRRSNNQVQKHSQAENLMELLAFYSMKKMTLKLILLKLLK